MKKILIAIDYNPCAQKIAETGFAYASAMNAEICIVHAIADIAYYFSMEYSPVMGFEGLSPDCAFKSKGEQENEAKRFLAAVVNHLGDRNIKTCVLDVKTSEAILEYAAEYKADLVVMGAHSHNGFGKIMGDVTTKVIKHAEIPVLIVPADKQELSLADKKQEILQYI
jgi:nucleotide-binding universal stress UspA family protein